MIGTTPVATTGLTRDKVSTNVQTAEDEDIYRHEAFSLPDFMRRQLGSVNINDSQANPFQPDLNYRGYTASPLLGTPIGLSVYQDGVRVNEPFGDIVNWDLIPRSAIANMELVPGSNPLYGLNTLGGAVSVRTKSGFSHPGTRTEAYGGSYGRKTFEFEHGGYKDEFDWFLTGNLFEDDGWRPFSHSAVRQAFGKAGWENDTTDLDFSFTFADNKLNGVGPTPASLLSQSRYAIYTAPDTTENTLYFFQLKGNHRLMETLNLTGNAYYRANTINTFNSNIGEDCASFLNNTDCLDANGRLAPAFSNAISRSAQEGSGTNVQLTYSGDVFARKNQFILGGGYNGGNTHFTQATQDAFLASNKATVGNSPFVTSTNLKSLNEYFSAFATDIFSPLDWLDINASVNWTKANIILNDRIGTALNGSHTFERVNPAVGFTVNPLRTLDWKVPLEELTLFGNYSEGFRAPSPVELTCADPNAPCSLPNSFISDPPLKPVVSQTFEGGLRGKFSAALQWSVAYYHSRSINDILFVNTPGGLINGFFQNVGNTQRQGVELGLNGAWEKLTWNFNYSFINAIYLTNAVLHNAFGPEQVRPGDRIPSIPQNTVKLGVEYELLSGWFVGGDLQYFSSRYVRGDDSNQFSQIGAYVLLNLNIRYVITKNVEVFAMARNISNAEFQNFGVLNTNFFTGRQERFLTPGAPVTGYAGIRVRFD
ncbi:TonB-dependent receptor [Candidatus Methylocalor cossyra]|uniref:TonB-dependent receptor n=1 Tax=Candidatus Methylocalor cossyra TaxID=3108543 RepID=UPI0032B23C29